VFKKILKILDPSQRRRWLILSASSLCLAILELVTAAMVALWVKSFLTTDPMVITGIQLTSQTVSGILLAFFISKCIFFNLDSVFRQHTIKSIVASLSQKLLRTYGGLRYADFINRNSSYYQSVIETDTDKFGVLMTSVSEVFNEILITSCLIGYLWFTSPTLMSYFLVGIVMIYGLQKLSLKFLKKIGEDQHHYRVMAAQKSSQFLHGFKEITLRGHSAFFVSEAHKAFTLREKAKAYYNILLQGNRPIIEVIFFSIIMIVSGSLGHSEFMTVLSAFAYIGLRLMQLSSGILSKVSTIKFYKSSLDAIIEAFSCPQKEIRTCPQFSFNQGIEVRGVSFAFGQRPILKNYDLTIQKGDKIGIVGATGSGKSTLVDVLLGLLDPLSGTVLVDGLYDVRSEEWKRYIGYVPQSIYLLDASIQDNISFGEPIDDNKITDIIHKTQLTKLIERLPNGINTIVGERGIKLSGGERQRIAIARALYKDPEVLIFDEATSALDHDTESKIMDTIYKIGYNKTLIMIAHRTSTLSRCNRIVEIGW
jgi:ABC-type multidrug transport system fused ATPase/permease subunit